MAVGRGEVGAVPIGYAAVITAGERLDEPFASIAATPFKALIRIDGTTLIERTICALRGAGIERIAVVAGDEVANICRHLVHHVIPAKNKAAADVWLALNAWEFEAPLLYATCDMPYIDAASVQWFLSSVPLKAVCMPLTAYKDFQERFPDAPPFGIKLGGERVVNGGLLAIPAFASHMVEAVGLRMYIERKRPLPMARIAGFEVLLRYVLGNLGIEDLERRARRVLTIPACAIRNAPPELGYDIETPAEYRYAVAHPPRQNS